MGKVVKVNAAELKSLDDAKFVPKAVYQSQGMKVVLAYFKEGQYIPVHSPQVVRSWVHEDVRDGWLSPIHRHVPAP